MHRFKSAAQLQRFLCIHGPIHNLFRVGRHHLKAIYHRVLRERVCLLKERSPGTLQGKTGSGSLT